MIDHRAKSSRAGDMFFLIGFGLINIFVFTYFFCICGFFTGAIISWWQFLAGGIAALVVNYFASVSLTGEKKVFVKSGAVIILLAIGSICLAGSFYDTSFDGQWYHQENVFRMQQGHNPQRELLTIPADESAYGNSTWCAPDPNSRAAEPTGKPRVNLKYLALNYFAKGTEVTEAAIYSFTGRMETAKAVNVLMLAASFLLCLAALYKVDKISVRYKWLLAVVLAFNPITCCELFTFCVDGFGGSALLCLFAVFALIMLGDDNWHLFSLFAVIVIAVNVKSTMLAYTAVCCLIFWGVLLLNKERRIQAKRFFFTGLVAGITGVVFFGFNPYITNYKWQHNAFYGLADVRSEIDRMSPVCLRGHTRAENLLLSVSAHVGWPKDDEHTFADAAKLPFSFNKSDILNVGDKEPGLGGFGPFYSGALLIALIALIFAAVTNARAYAFRLALTAFVCLLVTVMMVPDSWWSRFVPQMWLLPAVVLVMLSFVKFRGSNILKPVLAIAIILNVCWASLAFASDALNTSRVAHQLAQFKALKKPVYIQYCDYRNFKSNQLRLQEAGIPLGSQPATAGGEYDMPFSTTRIETASPLPEIPQGFLYEMRQHFISAP